MMIVTTTAEQTRFNKRNHGFSLKAANAPVSPLPAPCSTKRRRRIPEAPFLTASSRCLGELPGRDYDGPVREYSGLLPTEARERRREISGIHAHLPIRSTTCGHSYELRSSRGASP